jgi:hypothetical protein
MMIGCVGDDELARPRSPARRRVLGSGAEAHQRLTGVALITVDQGRGT